VNYCSDKMPRNRSGKRTRAATAKNAKKERLSLQYETTWKTWSNMSHRLCDFIDYLQNGYITDYIRGQSICLIASLPPLQLCETRKKYLSKIREYPRALEKFWATKLQQSKHLPDVLKKIKELEESSVERNSGRNYIFGDL